MASRLLQASLTKYQLFKIIDTAGIESINRFDPCLNQILCSLHYCLGIKNRWLETKVGVIGLICRKNDIEATDTIHCNSMSIFLIYRNITFKRQGLK